MGQKKAKMVKKVRAVGTKSPTDGVSFDPPIPFVFRDGKTGRAKCACMLEVADTRDRKAAGLSKRASIGPSEGMVFQECQGPFWMKDVEFPLDLVFTDGDGVVTEKKAMAVDKSGSRLYHADRNDSENAVELPFGFCRRHGIDVGDVVLPFGEK